MEGGCEMPRAQVVYPEGDDNRVFMPRGTILHRCSDNTGCCPQKDQTCACIKQDIVRVAFFVIDCSKGERRQVD